jgi:cytochrome c553
MPTKPHSIQTLLIPILCTLPLTVVAATSEERLLASQCAQCHGTDGRAVGDMESLAGESFQELYDELREMKRRAENGDIMHRQAKGYSDQQLRLIARYYSSLAGSSDRRRER